VNTQTRTRDGWYKIRSAVTGMELPTTTDRDDIIARQQREILELRNAIRNMSSDSSASSSDIKLPPEYLAQNSTEKGNTITNQ
jgi:hypothetical protein